MLIFDADRECGWIRSRCTIQREQCQVYLSHRGTYAWMQSSQNDSQRPVTSLRKRGRRMYPISRQRRACVHEKWEGIASQNALVSVAYLMHCGCSDSRCIHNVTQFCCSKQTAIFDAFFHVDWALYRSKHRLRIKWDESLVKGKWCWTACCIWCCSDIRQTRSRVAVNLTKDLSDSGSRWEKLFAPAPTRRVMDAQKQWRAPIVAATEIYVNLEE